MKKTWRYPRSYFLRKRKTGFLFSPGVLHDDTSMVQFCRRYTTVAGVPLTSKTGFEIIDPDNCRSCIFPEIIVREEVKEKKRQRVVSNGVLPNFFYRFGTWIRHKRINKKYGPEPNPVIKQFDIDLTRLNIAQEHDVDALMHTYRDYVEHTKLHNVVLYGFSRGAATTFKYMATKYKMQDKAQQKVQAIVLQGCFDSMMGTLKGVKFDVNKFLAKMLPNYTAKRIEPIDVVADFPRSVPVLFITSAADEVVPPASTKRLAKALKESGHPGVYFLELTCSPHSRYTSYHKEDMENLERIVHAFYAKHGVAHIPTLAKQGKTLLEKSLLV